MTQHQLGQWTSGTLKVSSSILTPLEIGDILGLEPSRSFEKGSKASPRNPASMIRSESVWLLEGDLPDDASLEDHLEALLERVEDRGDALAQVARSSVVEISVGCFCENGRANFAIGHDLFVRLSALPIALTFDLYPPTEIPVVTLDK